MPGVALRAGSASLTVDAGDGGRWTSLQVDGLELLSGAPVGGVAPRFRSGCFAMAPWAGRLDRGLLEFQGTTTQLPVDAPPHAIHGTVAGQPWDVVEADGARAVLATRLVAPWPYPGVVRQELVLQEDGLDARLVLAAEVDQPVTLGLHPWFGRRLSRGGELELDVRPRQQYARGADGLPTGELVAPSAGPWDDCFLGLDAPPRLVWPGALELELTSPQEHWVVFTERSDVACVEPQTGPPDAVRLGRADVVRAGDELALALSLRWTLR